ncbi:MAG: efflux RND transporter periplasmic adaptor subunit [Chlamydiae bacterium]|nr:MAG: efflux RND transporter periplasmic adaptor subunit [Chlamydiota bacterium]
MKNFSETQKKSIKILFGILMILIFLPATGCRKKNSQIKLPTKPVRTGKIIQKDVPIYIDTFGYFTANLDVDIKSEVTETLLKTHIQSGQFVTNGQLLFTLDISELKANLDQAKASLAEDQAQLKLKTDNLARNKQLFKTQVISAEAYEQSKTLHEEASAKVELDKAAIEYAQVQVDYCYIRAPMDSRAGSTGFDPGNLIQEDSATPLVNLKQIDPLTLNFTIPEKYLFDVKNAMAKARLKTKIFIEGDTNIYTGIVNFLDNKVDDQTGTVALQANVPNKDKILWPGQFVHVRLITKEKKNAILAPYEAVQLGRHGSYLFVVKPDKTVEMRMVKTTLREGDYIIIEEGVKPGEIVVTVGQLGLYTGVSVVETDKQKSVATVK